MRLGLSAQVILAACLFSGQAFPQQGWWMTEPVRWVQTNLRQTDAKLDPARLVDQLADMRANVLLMGWVESWRITRQGSVPLSESGFAGGRIYSGKCCRDRTHGASA